MTANEKCSHVGHNIDKLLHSAPSANCQKTQVFFCCSFLEIPEETICWMGLLCSAVVLAWQSDVSAAIFHCVMMETLWVFWQQNSFSFNTSSCLPQFLCFDANWMGRKFMWWISVGRDAWNRACATDAEKTHHLLGPWCDTGNNVMHVQAKQMMDLFFESVKEFCPLFKLKIDNDFKNDFVQESDEPCAMVQAFDIFFFVPPVSGTLPKQGVCLAQHFPTKNFLLSFLCAPNS